jgi:basic amino acid/polyamine antiporter, APA family
MAKAMVINTGSIALLAFVFGDYLSTLWPMGTHSSAWWALIIVLALTAVNILGLSFAAHLQTLFTAFVFFGLLLVAMSVFWIDTPASVTPPAFSSPTFGPIRFGHGVCVADFWWLERIGLYFS